MRCNPLNGVTSLLVTHPRNIWSSHIFISIWYVYSNLSVGPKYEFIINVLCQHLGTVFKLKLNNVTNSCQLDNVQYGSVQISADNLEGWVRQGVREVLLSAILKTTTKSGGSETHTKKRQLIFERSIFTHSKMVFTI